jgi:hypothetical protein
MVIPKDSIMERDLLLAYMAGFTDGEGCIRIGKTYSAKRSVNHRLEVIVANTDIKPLMLMHKNYGGHIRGRNFDNLLYWTVYNETAINYIKDIRPYLVTKAEQADVALEFFREKTKYLPAPNRRLPKEEIELRDRFYEKIKALKIVKPLTTTKGHLVYDEMMV